MTLERQRKTSLYVKRILSPPSKEPQVGSTHWVTANHFQVNASFCFFSPSPPSNKSQVIYQNLFIEMPLLHSPFLKSPQSICVSDVIYHHSLINLLTYFCSEARSESCISWSGGLWKVCPGHQNPCKVILIKAGMNHYNEQGI